jgi:sugar phosphate isomerase/epimerase
LKIGLSTWSLLGLDVVSAVRAVGDAGFAYIELWGDAPHAFPDWVNRGSLKDALSSYRMVVTMHAPFAYLNPATPFQPVKGAVENTLEDFVRFGDYLEARVITVHAGNVHNEALVPGSAENAISTIRKMVKVADGRLAISVENQSRSTSKYDYPLATTPESLEGFLGAVEGLRFTLDTGHAHVNGLNPSRVAQWAGSRLIEVHLSDNAGISDDHLIPGMGTADLKKLKENLSGTDVLLCLELNPHRYSPQEVLRASAPFRTDT